jgi:hypothetical protein
VKFSTVLTLRYKSRFRINRCCDKWLFCIFPRKGALGRQLSLSTRSNKMLRVCHYNDRRHSSDIKQTKIVVKHFLGDKRIGVNLYVKKLTEIYFFGGCAKNRKSLFRVNRCLSVYHNSNRREGAFLCIHRSFVEKGRKTTIPKY